MIIPTIFSLTKPLQHWSIPSRDCQRLPGETMSKIELQLYWSHLQSSHVSYWEEDNHLSKQLRWTTPTWWRNETLSCQSSVDSPIQSNCRDQGDKSDSMKSPSWQIRQNTPDVCLGEKWRLAVRVMFREFEMGSL